MTAYSRQRTGFPALAAAGVMAWCKLLATTGLPSDHHPWPGSRLHGVLVVDVDNVNPLLSSTPATADTGDVMPGRGNRHSFHLLVLYDAILSSVLFPQIRVLHSLG